MIVLPDSSILIAFFAHASYGDRIERELRAGRFALCSVVAQEVLAGARDRSEIRLYDRFFTRCERLGVVVTPNDESWRACGRLLYRYRRRYGDIRTRDHQNDVLIMLTGLQLAREQETVILTENDAHFATWLGFIRDPSRLRIEAARR
ncbi:MAG: PIN domain-containing protein [Chloroflexi bacterium]|nr:PIN domain-containing protein [Chloroflexota bacterium]